MKSKSEVRSTRSVPPTFPLTPGFVELLDAGDAKPAATSSPAPIVKATTESQSLLCMGLLSNERTGLSAGTGTASSGASDGRRTTLLVAKGARRIDANARPRSGRLQGSARVGIRAGGFRRLREKLC